MNAYIDKRLQKAALAAGTAQASREAERVSTPSLIW